MRTWVLPTPNWSQIGWFDDCLVMWPPVCWSHCGTCQKQMLRNCIWLWWLIVQADVKKRYMQWSWLMIVWTSKCEEIVHVWTSECKETCMQRSCRNCALHIVVTGVTKEELRWNILSFIGILCGGFLYIFLCAFQCFVSWFHPKLVHVRHLASHWYNCTDWHRHKTPSYYLTRHKTPSYYLTRHKTPSYYLAFGFCRCVTVSWCLP